jgi:hypothetical protein
MNNELNNRPVEERRAEQRVLSELLKRGLLPYRDTGGSIRANTPSGNQLEFRVAVSAERERGFFSVPDLWPRPELFLICVEYDGGEISEVWVFPSTSFFVYSVLDEEQGQIRLNLDQVEPGSSDGPLREYVSFFRDRWDPVVQFDDLREFMPPMDAPGFQRDWEDFEDRMMLMEFSESRDRDRQTGEPFEPPDSSDDSADYGRDLIELTPGAQQGLDGFPPDDRYEVPESIRTLTDNPHPSGSIWLGGTPSNYLFRRIP